MADKAALIAQLDAQRASLTASAEGVRANADIGARLKAGVARNRYAWLGGATLLGLVLVRLKPRKIHVDRSTGEKLAKTGLALAAARIAFDLAKPALVSWASARVADYLTTARSKPR